MPVTATAGQFAAGDMSVGLGPSWGDFGVCILCQLLRSPPVADGSAESHISFEAKTVLLPRTTRCPFWPYGERALQPSCQWLVVFARAFLSVTCFPLHTA